MIKISKEILPWNKALRTIVIKTLKNFKIWCHFWARCMVNETKIRKSVCLLWRTRCCATLLVPRPLIINFSSRTIKFVCHWVTCKWKLANQMGHSASLRLLYLDANDYVSELARVWGVRSLSLCLKLYLDFKEFSVNCLLELSLLTET